jgi:hypothetical protein
MSEQITSGWLVTLAQCGSNFETALDTGSALLCKSLHLAFFGPARFRRMVQNQNEGPNIPGGDGMGWQAACSIKVV